MRFKLTFDVIDRQQNILPINYQYEFSAWIYKTLHSGDSDFAEWLHSKGFLNKNKQFKLFSFSRLNIPERKQDGDRLLILCSSVSMEISFYPIEALTPFVSGLFENREFCIGDRKSKVTFSVQSVERLSEPEFTDNMQLKFVSPVHVVRQNPFHPEKKEHLHPEHKDFEKLLFSNLIEKYNSYNTQKEFILGDYCINIVTEPKEQLIKIKEGTPQETRLKGYLFEFDIKADPELLRIGYFAGFGKANSQGFGCVKIC